MTHNLLIIFLGMLNGNWEYCSKYGNEEILNNTNGIIRGDDGITPKYGYSGSNGWPNLAKMLNYNNNYTVDQLVKTFYQGNIITL